MSDPQDPTKKTTRQPFGGVKVPRESAHLHGKRVTQEMYEGFWEAWKRGTRVKRELARLFSLTQQTVTRLVEEGYPERGWLSMRERYRLYEQEQMRAQQTVLAKQALEHLDAYESAKQDNLKLLKATKAGVASMVRSWFENLSKVRWVRERRVQDKQGNWTTIEHSLTASEMARIELMISQTADNLLKQESLWLGGPTESVNLNAGAPGWFSLSAQQLDEIISTGQLPQGVTDEMLFGAQAVKLLAASPPAPATPAAPGTPNQN